MCESRSRPEPKPLFGRLARRATPRSFPKSLVRKLTIRSPSLNGQVCSTKASLTRAGIESSRLSWRGFVHCSHLVSAGGSYQVLLDNCRLQAFAFVAKVRAGLKD